MKIEVKLELYDYPHDDYLERTVIFHLTKKHDRRVVQECIKYKRWGHLLRFIDNHSKWVSALLDNGFLIDTVYVDGVKVIDGASFDTNLRWNFF